MFFSINKKWMNEFLFKYRPSDSSMWTEFKPYHYNRGGRRRRGNIFPDPLKFDSEFLICWNIVPSLIPPPWGFKKIFIPFCLHPVSMYDNKSQMNFEVFFPSKWRMSPIKQNFKQNDWCRVFYVIYDEHIGMYIYSDAKSS